MIRPLDSSTVRRISSGQVITKVEDVVKELIENSIDAESTSIEVKLVGDGLTSITVKDNGVGIMECDRPSMAMRSYTSKLCNFEDLSRLETYGFRGEALNSICAVTESTQIITKTENDPVAILYTLDRSGKVLHGKSSGSSPGTTVTAVKLFANIPVRRQVAQKNSLTGKNVQNLLITYALVHPNIRFSLKCENSSKLKFKEGDWIQPSMKTTMDAIIKLFGSELANEVQFGVWGSEYTESSNVDSMQSEEIILEAVLPKPDAVPHVIFKNGKTFIYVNSRPVVTARGEIKSLVSMVKSVYNEIACQNGWTGSPKTPFMWINIKLPTWAYDINVEPSKNVALFHHGELLIENISNLLEMIYDLKNQQKDQDASTSMEVDQPAEPILDDVNVNCGGDAYIEEIIVDPLERASMRTPDNSTQECCTPPSGLYNVQSDNLSEVGDQVLYSPSRSESSHRYSQRISGTTTPIHDHEMNSGILSMEKTNNDIRQYTRQEIHPARSDKGKQKMGDDRSRERKRHDRVQYNNLDNWLRSCQTQDADVSYDDEQGGNNFAQSPSRSNNMPHIYTESPSGSEDTDNYSRSPRNYNGVGGTHKLSPQNNERTGNLSLASLNNKYTFQNTETQRERHVTHTNDLREHPHDNVANSGDYNQRLQLENAMDSDPFVDNVINERGGYEDDDAGSMHKRPRTDYIDDNLENVVSETDLNEIHGSTSLLDVNKDNILQSETEVDINSDQLHNDPNGSDQQLQRKEMNARTIAIGQPTIDDLLKSGVVNIPDNKKKNNVATSLNAQLQSKKKSANDIRLALSLTDVLHQELKLKFNKQKVTRRSESVFKCSQIGYSLSCFNKLDYEMWAVTRKFDGKFIDILMVHGERIRELVTLETLATSTELNPTRKLLNPIDVTIEQLGPVRVIECLKRLTFNQTPDESGAGIWWNMVTQKCLTANGVKVRWREDYNGRMYIQLTHISPLVQFATSVEYFAHLMKHLCCLNMDNDKDIPFVNTRARLTMQILAREARQMVKHEDWTISKRDDEMKQRVKDATAYLMQRIQNFGCNSSNIENDEIDESETLLIMVKKKNNEEIWYNSEMVVKILWKNIEANLQ